MIELRFDGLEELRAELRRLPADLASEAGAIVSRAAETAYNRIRVNYPHGHTGNLQGRVTISQQTNSQFGAQAVVSSRAPHAWMYEHGTAQRHTSKGANRGQMHAAPIDRRMIPTVMRARKQMYEELGHMVQSHGLELIA